MDNGGGARRKKRDYRGVRSSDFVRTGVGGSHRKTAHPSGRRRLEPAAVPRCLTAGWSVFFGVGTVWALWSLGSVCSSRSLTLGDAVGRGGRVLNK